MNVKKQIIPIFITISVLALLILFRNIPAGKLWEGYSVLYTPVETDSQSVCKILNDCGIEEYACLENQKIPMKLKKDSPEYSLLRINSTSKENEYLYTRNNYFYDSSKTYKIFYIPNTFKKDLNTVLKVLKSEGIKAATDTQVSYPYILPSIILVLAIFLIILNKKKGLFFFLSILPVVFVAANPFYASAIAAILLFLVLIVITNIFDRKGFVSIIKKNLFMPILLLIGIAASFSSKILTGIFYISVLTAEFCILVLFKNIKTNKLNKNPDGFHPVFIKSARKVSIYGGKQKKVLPLLLISVIGVFVCFALSKTPAASNTQNSKEILLPGLTKKEQSADLPVLEDYCKWNFNVKAAPYKSLNKENNDSEYVVYSDYEQKENGIVQVDKYLYFNDNFKSQVISAIDDLGYESIERILKIQNNDTNINFISSNCYTTSILSIILMFISLFMLLFIYFSSIIKKGGKK